MKSAYLGIINIRTCWHIDAALSRIDAQAGHVRVPQPAKSPTIEGDEVMMLLMGQ
jgi:hypothetical protein